MKKNISCSNQKSKKTSGGLGAKQNQKFQIFPTKGPLGQNSNKPLAYLKKRLSNIEGEAYSYVLSSISLDGESFEQRGCGPNFEGGVLTLCTCKHQMRSRRTAAQWKGVWIAGFTSRTNRDHAHWLFYLARIKAAYDSHADLWTQLSVVEQRAKAAHLHFLGDVFKPEKLKLKGNLKYSPSHYHMPNVHAHRPSPSRNGWHKDINYRHKISKRHAPLLMADPDLTFIWKKPKLMLGYNHCRDYFKWDSIHDLISDLEVVS